MTLGSHMSTLSEAVAIEHKATLTPEMFASSAAVLVRELAAKADAARDPAAFVAVSKEFRAAAEALQEAVLRAGKRGDAVDALAERRAARRKAAPANPGRAAKGRK